MKTKTILITIAILLFSTWLRAEGEPASGRVTYASTDVPGGTIIVTPISDNSFRLTAKSKEGYTFLQWSDGIKTVSRLYTHNATDDNPEGDKTIWAVFTLDEDMEQDLGYMDVEVLDHAIPNFILRPTANYGATFFGWNNGSKEKVMHYYLQTDDRRYPIFQSTEPYVTYDVDEHAGGTITIERESATSFEIFANAAQGYSFLQWADGKTDNPREIEMESDEPLTLSAIFTYTKDVVLAHGSVTTEVHEGTPLSYTLTATATPNSGYEFYEWNNADENKSIEYKEEEGQRYPIFKTTSAPIFFTTNHAGGVVEVSYEGNNQYTLTAVPNEGYSFVKWADDEPQASRTVAYGTTTEDKLYYAIFTYDAHMKRQLGSASLSVVDHGNETPSYTLSAEHKEGAQFLIWSNGVKSNPTAYAEADGECYPMFYTTKALLTYEVSNHPGGIVSVQETNIPSKYHLSATAAEGYTFKQWSDNNFNAERDYEVSLTDKDATELVHAIFTKDEDMEVPQGIVSVDINNPAIPTFQLTANPTLSGNCASHFYMWTNGVTNKSINYQESDGVCRPFFIAEKPVGYVVDNQTGGNVEVEKLSCGFRLTAIANDGYSFTRWEDGSIQAVREVDYIEGDYKAFFSPAAFKVGDVLYNTYEEAITIAGVSLPIELVNNYQGTIVVTSPVKLLTNNYKIGTLDIRYGGDVTLLDYTNIGTLALMSTKGKSSQIHPASNINAANAYIDITFKDSQNDNNWYGFGVPFEVDVEDGVARADGVGTHVSLTDYLIWYYDGNIRLNTGTGWVRMTSGTLRPGQFYMIGVVGPESTWRFSMKSGTIIEGSNTYNVFSYGGNENPVDGGWNALANGLTQYAIASVKGVNYCQVYDNTNISYLPINIKTTTLVMGTPFFIQTNTDNIMKLKENSETNPGALYAPRIENDDEATIYEIRLSNSAQYDALFICADENAMEMYEVGKDLIKMFGNATNAYIWSEAYGQRLCAQNAKKWSNETYFSVVLSAPQQGVYTLSASEGDDSVYLILDDGTKQELSQPYDLFLKKGNNYVTLCIGENAFVPTDIFNVGVENEVQKVLYNDVIYIVRGGVVYNTQGVKIK